MSKINKSIVTKICISVFSLLFFLGLLEAGLRITGYFYLLNRAELPLFGINSIIKEEEERSADLSTDLSTERDYTILSIGDSYTFGGLNKLSETYPYFLEKKITKANYYKNPLVINGGICEYNSKQVLIRLPGWIEKYKPNMVILLVGAADRYNFAGYSFRERNIKSMLYNLRIYKMVKIISLNIKARILSQKTKSYLKASAQRSQKPVFGMDSYPMETRADRVWSYIKKMARISHLSESQSPSEKAWYYYNKGKRREAVEFCEEALKTNPNSIEILCTLALFYYNEDFYISENNQEYHPQEYEIQQAAAFYSKALQIAPESEFVLDRLAYFYMWCAEDYGDRNRFDLAVDFFSKTIELDPANTVVLHFLTKAYGLQSKYDADYIIQTFQKMLKNNADLNENKFFMNYFAFFKNKEKWDKKNERQLKKNLEEIVELCQKNKVEVVFQNYPYPYSATNRILENIALKYSLPFVDNCAIFNELVAGEGRSRYFLDDSHCTTKGYQVMAENIYNIIIRKDIIK